jgi:signal transduction histidine kinase
MNSIRARLLLALIVLVAGVSALTATITYRRVLNETSTLFDYQLRQMALSLRGQISIAPRIEVPPDQGDMDFVIQIWDLFGSRMYLSRPGLPMINQTVLGYADLSLQGQAWRAYGLQTRDGVIQIAQPVRVRERLARASAWHIVIPLLLLLPVLSLLAVWTVGRGLRPLRRLTADIQRRDVRSLTPLAARNLPREIDPLVAELNRLLARLRASFAMQHNFIADAAHELRSPLTALRLQLQLLDRAPDPAAREDARVRLGDAIERAIHLTEQLLALARSDPQDRADPFEVLDLATLAADAVKDSHLLASLRRIDVGLDSPPTVIVRADREALRILLRNLIDNAVRYTPAGGTVEVLCSDTAQGARLEVLDTGPGIAPGERERVFDRFYRRAGTLESGSGLGLAIVKAVADRHDARVTLGDAPPPGGLRVTVQFPPTS